MRKETDRLIDMIENELVNPKDVITMFLKYMSEDDVADMMDMNELSERFDYDENESYSEKCDKLDNGTYYTYEGN